MSAIARRPAYVYVGTYVHIYACTYVRPFVFVLRHNKKERNTVSSQQGGTEEHSQQGGERTRIRNHRIRTYTSDKQTPSDKQTVRYAPDTRFRGEAAGDSSGA